MPEIRRLSPADHRRVPWRNGRGVTEEIAVGPAGASFERGETEWRVSRASVVQDGPFSDFPGFDRILVVTGGAGLALRHGAGLEEIPVLPLDPHRFPGDVPTEARLLGGAVRDFNVFARRDRCTADVEVLRPGPSPRACGLPGGAALVHVVSGRARLAIRGGSTPGRPEVLGPGASLLLRDLPTGWSLAVAGVEAPVILLTRLVTLP